MGGRRTRLRELCCSIFFLFLTGARCSNQAENYYMRGDRIFLLSEISGFICFHCFCGAPVPCAVLFLFRTDSISKEENRYPTWGMYVRTACGVRAVFPNRTLSSWHLQIACLHLIARTVCCCCIPFSFMSTSASSDSYSYE